MKIFCAGIIAGCIALGLFVGPKLVPDRSDRIAPWWQTGRARITTTHTGIVTYIEGNTFTLEEPGSPPLVIAYDTYTLLLARPERSNAGVVDSIRLVYAPIEEVLVPGTIVRTAIRTRETAAPPYAFAITALPH